jgi:superoxide dismutase, Fe-Mn family
MNSIYVLPQEEISGFLSKVQLTEHYKLYKGYYDQVQSLPATINGLGSSSNPTSIRGAQKTLQYALSGKVLHEIYFDLMSANTTSFSDMSDELKALIVHCFGSVEGFIADMKAAAKMSRGWYRLEHDTENNLLYHNVGDFHDEGSTSGFKPLIALDMYDHAYFYDYQTNKGLYIDNFVNHLDWKKVSARLSK